MRGSIAARGGRERRGENPFCLGRAVLACLALYAWRSVVLADCFSILLRIAGWFGISLREHLRKPGADDTGYLGHEVGDLLPFLR